MSASVAGAEHRSLPASHVAAVVLGNALQFYDFLTYAFFATQIAGTFFPSHDPSTSLLASLATFGAGFLTRPIGAGGDRPDGRPGRAQAGDGALVRADGRGDRRSGSTPSYAMIGVAAPIAAIVFVWSGVRVGRRSGAEHGLSDRAAPPPGAASMFRCSTPPRTRRCWRRV